MGLAVLPLGSAPYDTTECASVNDLDSAGHAGTRWLGSGLAERKPNMNHRNRRAGLRAAWLMLAMGWLAASTASAEAPRDEQVMAVLDQYMDAINALDIERHVDMYHFPHFRLSAAGFSVWQNALEAMPILAAPQGERRQRLREALGPEWHRSEWTRREIVQGDDTKVHIVTTFVRLREDGSEIAAYDSLYVLTFEAGRWAIKGRSSFAQ
jgi:hypothetical protein